jgi:hypothetical protein
VGRHFDICHSDSNFHIGFHRKRKELLKQRGINTLFVRLLDALPKKLQNTFRWERLRSLWWLWSIFGLSGGVALALWLTPVVVGHPANSENDNARQAVQSQLTEVRQERDQAKQTLTVLQTDITSKNVELENEKQQLAGLQSTLLSTQTELTDIQHREQTRIGSEMAIEFVGGLGLSGVLQTIPKTFIVLTSSPDNEPLRSELEKILNQARGISGGKSPLLPMPLPDYNKNLDAPRLIGNGKSGITIHGRNQAGDFLMEVLAGNNCLILHQTGQTPDELLSYYNRIYTSSDVHNIAWIEIGSGRALQSSECLAQLPQLEF